MKRYSQKLKEMMVEKLLMPGSKGVYNLSKESGISTNTLYNWLKEANSGEPKMTSRKNWTLTDKLNAILLSAQMKDDELGKWMRENGVHAEHLKLWKQEIEKALSTTLDTTKKELYETKQENKILKKEIAKKDKTVSEMSTMLVLKKKYKSLFEDEEN